MHSLAIALNIEEFTQHQHLLQNNNNALEFVVQCIPKAIEEFEASKLMLAESADEKNDEEILMCQVKVSHSCALNYDM